MAVYYSLCTVLELQLKAYQKKKKKTKSKNKHTEPTDVSSSEKDASSKSEPTSLSLGLNDGAGAADTTGGNVSGNASPIPFDDFGNSHIDDNLSLPHDFTSRMSTSLPIVSVVIHVCTCINVHF